MNISGIRLKKARLFRNLTISELAEKTSVTKQAISQYEKGIITPKPEILFQLISELKFPLAFFGEIDNYNNMSEEIENTFFRALNSTKILDLDTQRVKTEFIVKIYNFLGEYLTFPKLDLPLLDYHEELNPEDIAMTLRNHWNIGFKPILNMVSLLEKKGIIVSSIKTDSNKIDAFTQIHSNNGIKQYCVVLGNEKQSMVRRNFDAAHELGHIILHNQLPDIKEMSKDEFKKMEQEANQFAAAFLLPKDTFYNDLINPSVLNSYKSLKEKWKVSIGAMIMRARQLERINANQYLNLMKQISYKGWRKKEPFDDLWKVQRPQLFKQSIKILIENNILSSTQIVTQLGIYGCSLHSEDVEKLLDLEAGDLREQIEEDSNLILLVKN